MTPLQSLLVTSFLLGACSLPLSAADPQTGSGAADRLAWWREARFGLFIHWGPVSLKGTEISWSRVGERRGYDFLASYQPDSVPAEEYDNLYRQFNPTQFDAREWVAIARAAGAKYLVFTARHHDGFSMFDTQANDYKITSPLSPFRRDIVKELADACHEAGLRFGIYYSQPDFLNPDAFIPGRHDRYLAYLRLQVRELLAHYGRVDILWYDGLSRSAEDFGAPELNRMARELQPGLLINDRNGLPEDFDTPEQRIGEYQDTRPWESCITICHQWSWRPGEPMKPLAECLHTLIRCAGGDGNLLFNVGPMPDGRIEPGQVARLKEMGAWLERHGESIYGTRGGPFKPGQTLASTRRGNVIYLHLLDWDGRPVTLPAIARKVVGASVLGGGPATAQQKDGALVVTAPAACRNPIDTIVRLELDGPAMDLPAVAVP